MYGDFAYIYDKLSFDLEYEKYAGNIKKLARENKIGNDRMLELACGSGMLTEHFFDDFKKIDAVDLSEDMLTCFRSKFNKDHVSTYLYDMVDFENEGAYDLIVILLDSINYVTDKARLKRLFENSYKNLKDGGLLVFDINSLYKMREVFGSNCFVYEYEDIFYTWDNILEDDLVDMELNFFIENPDGSYKRIIERQIERIYEPDFIKDLVGSVGFKDIRAFDEDDMGKVKDKTMRILYQARKEVL